MHSSEELRSSDFAIEVGGRRGGIAELFDGFGEHDRLGVVLGEPCGAVGLGDHRRLDVWPGHKEVVVEAEAQRILEAIDDRAITRLLVEDGVPVETYRRIDLDEALALLG
jgi:hypothetical protein